MWSIIETALGVSLGLALTAALVWLAVKARSERERLMGLWRAAVRPLLFAGAVAVMAGVVVAADALLGLHYKRLAQAEQTSWQASPAYAAHLKAYESCEATTVHDIFSSSFRGGCTHPDRISLGPPRRTPLQGVRQYLAHAWR